MNKKKYRAVLMLTSESALNDNDEYYIPPNPQMEEHDHNYNVVNVEHHEVSVLGRKYSENYQSDSFDEEDLELPNKNVKVARKTHPKMGVLAKKEVYNWLMFKTESEEESFSDEDPILAENIDNEDHLNNNAVLDDNERNQKNNKCLDVTTKETERFYHHHSSIFKCSQDCFDENSQCHSQTIVLPNFNENVI